MIEGKSIRREDMYITPMRREPSVDQKNSNTVPKKELFVKKFKKSIYMYDILRKKKQKNNVCCQKFCFKKKTISIIIWNKIRLYTK